MSKKYEEVIVEKHYWDLSVIFKGEQELQKKVKKLQDLAIHFEKKYKNQLEKQSEFQGIIAEYEEIIEGIASIGTYTFLTFAQDSGMGDFYAKYEMICNEIQSHILFFELEFCKLPSETQQLFIESAPKYAYYLQNLIKSKPHQLKLEEEQVLLEFSPVGVGAFSRFFDEHFSRMRFKITQNKKIQKIGEEEILAYLHSCNRKERKEAHKIFSKKLKKSSHFLTYVLNMVRKDLSINTKLRKYEKPESFRHLDNSTTQQSVDSLIGVVEKNYFLVEKYYLIKKELLGLKKLKDYDRYAPIQTKEAHEIPYTQALEQVLQSFQEFSPTFEQIAQVALKGGWVDSHPKDRKRGGAFSHGCVPSAHPYVLLNYTNGRRDVFTIAHEFGHMIHQELSKKQGYLNMDTPLTTAETASVFAEMLLFDTLKKTTSKEELLGLYAGKLEDIFSTLFRQIVMTKFERRIHDKEGELKTEDFDKIWREENQKMFGSSIDLTKKYNRWWCYIPHFIHSPFYCYAYSYGQLLVLALFGLYKQSLQEGRAEEFKAKYIEFLSSGGSQSPRDLILKFGFDVESEEFWNIGMKQVELLLEEFIDIVGQR